MQENVDTGKFGLWQKAGRSPYKGNRFMGERNLKKEREKQKEQPFLWGKFNLYRLGYQPLTAYRHSLSSPEREKRGPKPFLGPYPAAKVQLLTKSPSFRPLILTPPT